MTRLMWLVGGAMVTVSMGQIAGLPGLFLVLGLLLMLLAYVMES